jgi:hypothetical protein
MNNLASGDRNPPRWLESLLLLLLKRRDRETVSGDLLEEYREVILPTRGASRANLWYLKQVLSMVDQVRFGMGLGFVLGSYNLISTLIAPLGEDTPLGMLSGLAVVMLLWALSGFAAERRTARFWEATKAGAVVGFVSLGLFHIAVILRLNIFLDVVSQRSDWHGMIMNFQESGFKSLRAYANWKYFEWSGVVLFLGMIAGGVCGTLGGLVASVFGRGRSRLSCN